MKESLMKWCEANQLIIEFVEDNDFVFVIGGKRFYVVVPETENLIDKKCNFELSEDGMEEVAAASPDYLAFSFGGRWYYCKVEMVEDEDTNEDRFVADFNDLKYIGECDLQLAETPFAHLGVHTEYELLNGSHKADYWCKKALFYKQKTLALCDRNTLAGTLPFQVACQKEGIKSIIGMTATIAIEYVENILPETYELKLYATNEQGWQNLLQINKCINVDYPGIIPQNVLLMLGKGIICVLPPTSRLKLIDNKEEARKHIGDLANSFADLYYQIDTVQYYAEDVDTLYLQKIRDYVRNLRPLVKPVLIGDSYYLDKEMFSLKEMLNKVDKKAMEYTEDAHYKSLDEHYLAFAPLFKNEQEWVELFDECVVNTMEIANKCNFVIGTGKSLLPSYQFLNGKTKEEMFFDLLEQGMAEKILPFYKDKKLQEYIDRVEKEVSVIIPAGFIDYCLILWDIISASKKKGVFVGTGRGSVAGSLLAFLLDITTVDPIKHDLLFERFMNETRAMPEIHYTITQKDGTVIKAKKNEKVKFNEEEVLVQDIPENKVKSVFFEPITRPDQNPDIDVDFQSDERDNVKDYIKQKFGEFHTCSVGTFGRLKLKSAMTDFGREKGVDFSYLKIITKDIDDEQEYSFKDFMRYCLKSEDLYKFAQKYPDIIHLVKHCSGQAKTCSVHASAVIIVPSERNGQPMNIFNWLPVRKVNGKLVSEWEGKYTDRAGFLKEDILGLSQLDKFRRTIELIKRNTKKVIDLNTIPLNDNRVFELFKKGYTEDVFQFGSWGLKKYSVIAQPDSVEDLTAMTSLYRPGPMESEAHLKFARIKAGKEKAEFDNGFEKVTAKTFGLLIYQEQIMQSMVVAGLSLVESDLVRTMMKKFDKVAMKKFKDKFVDGLVKKGVLYKGENFKYSPEEADKVWDKMVAFSGYGFNRSHALAYSLISYQSQWLKVNYPLEFWTASLQYAHDDFVAMRISEINKLKQGIEVKPPSINNSNISFDCSRDTMSIYWSLSKIKNLGEATVKQIIDERNLNGLFGSYDDFVKRVAKGKVNKRHVTCLILSGAFDEIEGIRKHEERYDLLMRHYRRTSTEVPDDFKDAAKIAKKYFWTFKQRELIGFGEVDYKDMLANHREAKKYLEYYHSPEKLAKAKDYSEALIIGKVIKMKKRKTKRDDEMVTLTLLNNNEEMTCVIWSDCYEDYREFIDSCENELIGILGKVRKDTYNGNNTNKLNTTEHTKIVAF